MSTILRWRLEPDLLSPLPRLGFFFTGGLLIVKKTGGRRGRRITTTGRGRGGGGGGMFSNTSLWYAWHCLSQTNNIKILYFKEQMRKEKRKLVTIHKFICMCVCNEENLHYEEFAKISWGENDMTSITQFVSFYQSFVHEMFRLINYFFCFQFRFSLLFIKESPCFQSCTENSGKWRPVSRAKVQKYRLKTK